MKRTLLYYPKMAIKSPKWIRQAILYWDEIASISVITPPYLFEDAPEQGILAEFGLYRIFDPIDFFRSSRTALREEFISIIETHGFKKIYETTQPGKIWEQKLDNEFYTYIVDAGYAKRYGEMVLTDRKFALLYMSLLAKHMANNDALAITTPGTDHKAYFDLVYSTENAANVLPSISWVVNNILPVPREDVSIKSIIEFKSKRYHELLKLRQAIYNYQDKIKQAKNKAEAVEILDRFASDIRIEVALLDKLLADAKIPVVLGAIENILKVETPTLIAGLATIGIVPLPLTIAGVVVAGSISLRKYQLDTRNAIQEKLVSNSFSYLYHAQQEGII